MNEPMKLEDVHPTLRPVVQQFMLKCKYPYTLAPLGRFVLTDEGGETKSFPVGVSFYDPKAKTMDRAGALRWQQGDFGKPYKFRIVTRKVLNPRYRDSERQHSVETQDATRALKEMLTHIKPFTLKDIAEQSMRRADVSIARWRTELNDAVGGAFSIARDAMVREVLNMQTQGIRFVTPEFQKIADEGIAAYNEAKKRSATSFTKHFVKFNDNGTIDVLSPEGAAVYTTFDQLPVAIQETIGMLKLMHGAPVGQPDNADIPGTGLQVASDQYWVTLPIEK